MFGVTFGLETTRQLCRAAGNPHDKLQFIHVAGTNGKGSTCAMLETIYRAAGLRVGLYTSPHLVSFRERIQVNRELISEADVMRLVDESQRWLHTLPADTAATFFEVVTVMALRYFAEQRCNLVIWETGLGGRLDATNIVTPLASVITNVQFDHEKWLGDSLENIAREKAGIIKARVPVVTGVEDSRALEVISEIAAQQLAPLHTITNEDVARVPKNLPVAGEHQRINAAVALRVVQVLNGALPVTPEIERDGLKHLRWPARFQVVTRGSQTIVLDGAHNPAGARALVDAVRSKFPSQSLTLVLGVLEDKNWRDVCHTLAPLAAEIITVPVASARSADAAQLAAACREANPNVRTRTEPSCAEALKSSSGASLILLTGSLYFVGEAIEVLGLSTAPGERALNEWTPPAQRSGN